MASGSGFRMETGVMKARIDEFDARIYGGISAAVDFSAAGGEVLMKTEAPWTDRTTAARNGLHTKTYHELERWTIVFAHAVNYGIWLETRRDFEGRYAIILKSLLQTGQNLMRTLDSITRRV